MLPGLIAAAAGTGLGMYGTQKKKKALRGASQAYNERIQLLMRQRDAANVDAQQQLSGLSDEHNAQLGDSLKNWMAADQVGPDATYAPHVQDTVAALRSATPEQNTWNAASGASSAAVSAQGTHAANRLSSAIQAGEATDKQRRLGTLRENALTPYTTGEMSRAARLKRLQQAFALRQAGISNSFALDQQRMQGDLNAAGRAGDHGIMWGSLLQSLGGSMMGQGGYGGEASEAPMADPGTTDSNIAYGGWAGYDEPRYPGLA